MPTTRPEHLIQASESELSALMQLAPVTAAEIVTLSEIARNMATANPAESLRIARIAEQAAVLNGGDESLARAWWACAIALRAQARWAQALEAFEAGAKAAARSGNRLLAATTPRGAIDTLAHLGRHEEALVLADRLENELNDLGASEDAAKVVWNAGGLHFQREAYHQALACWERALEFFSPRDYPLQTAILRMNSANVLTHLNRLPEALEMYELARPPFEEGGQTWSLACLEGNIAFHLFMGGRYTESLKAYARARAQFALLATPKDVAQCDREAADVYLELNLIPEAKEAFERVIPTFTTLQMTGEAARSELGLATALFAEHRGDEAMRVLNRAESTFRKDGNQIGVARSRLQRADWLRRLETDGANSRREAAGALRTFQRQGVMMGALQSRLHLAELAVDAGGSPIRQLRRLARDAEAGAYISLLWQIETVTGRAYNNAGNKPGALRHYRRAVEAVEHVRLLLFGEDFRVAFLQDKMPLYEELLALLMDHGTPKAMQEGFQLVERAKSRTLLELLANSASRAASHAVDTKQLIERLESLRAQLNWDYARVQRLGLDGSSSRLSAADTEVSDRLPQIEREYLHTHRQLQILGAVDSPLSAAGFRLSDLQSLLGRDEQIVQYATVRDELMAFVFDRGSFQTVRCIASRSEVEDLVERLKYQWSKFGPSGLGERYPKQTAEATNQILGELYGMLLEPLEPYLQAERVTVIPHGALHSVPFHALYNGAEFALNRWEFAYAPSAAVWRACRLQSEPTGDRSIVFGVSDPGIAHVKDEVAALRRILINADVLEDAAATLSTVPMKGSFQYVHFATHAIFRKDNPLFSGLQLADGWLIAHDLYHRRIECRLATLSACRTGLSSVLPGDELLGLVRGFLCAGARAVMVSLWAAHDSATADLMERFYQGLSNGMTRAASLRAAQTMICQRFPHPYYWAAFEIVGAR